MSLIVLYTWMLFRKSDIYSDVSDSVTTIQIHIIFSNRGDMNVHMYQNLVTIIGLFVFVYTLNRNCCYMFLFDRFEEVVLTN